MRLVTATIILGTIIIAAATALALLGLGGGTTPHAGGGGAPSAPQETTSPTTPSPGGASIQYDTQLAQKGIDYFKSVGCTACHSIKSLGISAGAVGPDLSRALTKPSAQWLGRFYKEHGLDNPAADPQKAAQLLAQYLTNPPSYSNTMVSQVNAYKSLYGDQWEKDYVPALVEMMKMAATK